MAGRPKIDVDLYFAKIEANLQLGYSLHKACLYAQVPYRQLHEYYDNNEDFRNKVEAVRGSLAVRARRNLAEVILNDEIKDEKGNVLRKKFPQPMVNDVSLEWLSSLEKDDFSKLTQVEDVSGKDEGVEMLRIVVNDIRKDVRNRAKDKDTGKAI